MYKWQPDPVKKTVKYVTECSNFLAVVDGKSGRCYITTSTPAHLRYTLTDNSETVAKRTHMFKRFVIRNYLWNYTLKY